MKNLQIWEKKHFWERVSYIFRRKLVFLEENNKRFGKACFSARKCHTSYVKLVSFGGKVIYLGEIRYFLQKMTYFSKKMAYFLEKMGISGRKYNIFCKKNWYLWEKMSQYWEKM